MFKFYVILSEFELVYWTYTIIFMHGLFFVLLVMVACYFVRLVRY